MGRRNLIPITRIYDIYPKYTYSDDVKKFMDEIVDIDRANVYTKDEVIAMLTELNTEIEELEPMYMDMIFPRQVNEVIQKKINALKAESEGKE